MNADSFDILTIGFTNQELDKLLPVLSGYTVKSIKTADEVMDVLSNLNLGPGVTILVGTSIAGMGHNEVAQSFSSYFQGVSILFVTWNQLDLSFTTLKKNGYTEVFYLPLDQKKLFDHIDKVTNTAEGKVTKRYKAVKLVDISEDEEVPFEIKTYLSFNKKYVTLNASGKVSPEKLNKLKGSNTSSVYINSKQIEQFYKYTSDKLIKLNSNTTLSETERTEKVQHAVSQLFRSILDVSNPSSTFESGNELAEQSKKVVELYIQDKIGVNLSDRIRSLIGEGNDAYSHAQIVSTFSCLISMATQLGNPEELAIAGLFHDLGVEGVPEDTNIFNYTKLPEEQKQKYMLHPTLSLNLLKEKRISITTKISDTIERHHERIDGKGFPKQMLEHRIPVEAHILAYADALEYLTRKESAFGKLSLEEIHKKIEKELFLHPEVLKKISEFMLNTKMKSD